MTRIIKGLGEIADSYDVLLSDVWGVIHNGREAFGDPCAALARWRRERGPVILISNSPRPASDVVAQLDEHGGGSRRLDKLRDVRRRDPGLARARGRLGRPGGSARTAMPRFMKDSV